MRAQHRIIGGIAVAAVVAVIAGTALLPDGEPEGRADGGRPNVVVIMTDDQNVGEVEVMEAVRREIAARGTTFENFFATFPLCCPSRATFLTGQYAHNHGVVGNIPERGGGLVNFDDSATVAVALRRAGYRTGFIGKYVNGYQALASDDPSATPRGWTTWLGAITPGRMFDWELNENGAPRWYRGARNYQTDVLTRKATGFIRESAEADEPFFLSVWTLAPHREPKLNKEGGWPNPRPAPRHRGSLAGEQPPRPESFNEADVSDKPSFVRSQRRLGRQRRSDVRRMARSRRQSLLAVDDLVDRVVGALRETGELDDTYVIFTSDHGYLLGEHRLTGKDKLYDESAGAPLAIRGPDVPGGARRTQVTGNIDIVPTILDATGVEPLREPDGISLLPLLADPDEAADRQVLLHRGLEPSDARRGSAGEDDVHKVLRSTGLRGPRHAYYVHRWSDGEAEYELYDLEADPHQLENLIGPGDASARRPEDEARVERLLGGPTGLRARLRELRGCRGHEGPRPCD